MKIFRIFLLYAVVLFIAAVTYSPVMAAIDPEYYPKLKVLTEKLKSRGFTQDNLDQLFSDERVQIYPGIVTRTGKGFNYMNRRFGLLKKKSVKNGQHVLQRHLETLKRLESASGVDKEIIVAILRIETNFGSATGTRPVFNSLLTMALVENRRSQWAETELAELLTICREQTKDPLTIKGSWAGAFGIPQFIPSSYAKYAVDGDGDGNIDLFNLNDAMASIASYLKSHGWQRNQPAKNRNAVYAYNHCDSYVKAVFTYARALKKTRV